MEGYTYIYKPKKYDNYYRFRSKSDFFSQAVLYELDENYLVFKPAGLDDNKPGVIHPRFDKEIGRWVFGLTLDLPHSVPSGNYNFDEDSHEDEVVIYLG